MQHELPHVRNFVDIMNAPGSALAVTVATASTVLPPEDGSSAFAATLVVVLPLLVLLSWCLYFKRRCCEYEAPAGYQVEASGTAGSVHAGLAA